MADRSYRCELTLGSASLIRICQKRYGAIMTGAMQSLPFFVATGGEAGNLGCAINLLPVFPST